MSKIVTEKTFDKEVLQAKIPVLVDFYADWCGPCKMLSPLVDELAKDYSGKVSVVKLNVDEAMNLAQHYGVMSIPTLVFFKKGKEVDRSVGVMTKEALGGKLEALL